MRMDLTELKERVPMASARSQAASTRSRGKRRRGSRCHGRSGSLLGVSLLAQDDVDEGAALDRSRRLLA